MRYCIDINQQTSKTDAGVT